MNTLTKIDTLRVSSALAVATTEYGVHDTAKKSGLATATTSNKLTASAGDFVTNAIAVGDVVKNTTTGKYALVTAVDSATALSLSADIFSNTNAYSIYPGLGYKLQQAWEQMIVTLDVTAAATEAGDTFDVYIDTSFDGGTTWLNIGHFTQVLGNGGAKKFVMAFKNDNPGASAVYNVTSDAAAGATRQTGFGDRIRYRATTVDVTTADNLSFTYSLGLFFKGGSN